MSRKIEKITEQQTWDVLQFAQSLHTSLSSLGVQTPDLAYENMLNLNNNPLKTNYDAVMKQLSYLPNSQDTINSFVQYMEYIDAEFSKILEYKIGLLSFDYAVVPTVKITAEDIKSKKYKEDKRSVYEFMQNFDKRYFYDIVKNMCRNGVYYTWFRTNNEANNVKVGNKYSLQMMPQDRCKITRSWENGFLYDIDLSFLNSGTQDIDLYPSVFKQYWCDLVGEDNYDYRPSSQFASSNGVFGMWHQTTPLDGAWCFKYDTSNFNVVSPMARIMKDTALNAEIQKLQYDKDIIGAYGILAGDLGMLKNATEKNAVAFEPEILGRLLNQIQSGLKRNIKIVTMPAEGVDFYQFEDKNKDMYTNQLSTTASNSVSAGRLIYSRDKMGQQEMQSAILVDYNEMKKLYSQFDQFFNYFANQKTKKYNFNIIFDGSTQLFEQKARQEKIHKLAEIGLTLSEDAFAQAYGFPPHIFSQMLTEGKHGELQNKLTYLKSIHTASSKEQGRPTQNDVATDARDYENSNNE